METKPSHPEAFDGIDVEQYLTVLAIVANADTVLRPEEMAFFEGRMARLLVNPSVRNRFRQLLKLEFDIEKAMRDIDERTLRLALRDGIFLAAADGEIHPAEIETIRIVAQHAGVNDDRLGEIWSWVKHGLEWMSEGPRLVEVPLKGD